MAQVIDVDKGELARTRVNGDAVGALTEGQALLAIERFALTTNNITYAVFGDAMKYWNFFPVPGEGNWGRVPVWGFAEVVESRHGEVTVGQRFYGYYPMGSHLVVSPGRVDARGFTDLAPHRAEMAAAYNRYSNVAADPIHRDDREAEQMILWPLFMTSFMIDDFLGDRHLGNLAAATVVVSSASSKTSIGAAHLAARRTGVEVVGLTSTRNLEMVRGLDCYHRVVDYADIASSDFAGPVFYVDVAGDRAVNSALHRRLAAVGADHRLSLVVGGTHWNATPSNDADVPGPRPEFFFAPSQIAARTKEWGREGLDQRVGAAWDRFADWSSSWMTVRSTEGAAAVESLYQEMLAGRVDPRVGHLCRVD